MIRFLGIFCTACAVVLQMSKKKSDKGEETWESKHNITIKKWWYICLYILGFVFIFGTNFHANLSATTPEGTKEIASYVSSDSEEDTQDIDEKETEESVKESENNTNDLSNSSETATMSMSDGFTITLSTPEEADVSQTNDVIGLSIGSDYHVMYSDSFVEVNNEDAVIEYYKNVNIPTENIKSYEISGAPSYVGDYVDENNIHKEYILQDVGSSNYLNIEISDYENAMSTEDLISKFGITVK